MIILWDHAPARRPAIFADANGHRLFVQQTVRSFRARGIVGHEYQAMIDGVRLGEFDCLVAAQNAALHAAETKTAPQGMRGRLQIVN